MSEFLVQYTSREGTDLHQGCEDEAFALGLLEELISEGLRPELYQRVPLKISTKVRIIKRRKAPAAPPETDPPPVSVEPAGAAVPKTAVQEGVSAVMALGGAVADGRLKLRPVPESQKCAAFAGCVYDADIPSIYCRNHMRASGDSR